MIPDYQKKFGNEVSKEWYLRIPARRAANLDPMSGIRHE